jgi:RNA exonuclease 4
MLVPGAIPPPGVPAHVSPTQDARMMQVPYYPMQQPYPGAPMYGAQFGGMHPGQPTALPYPIVQILPGQPVFSIDVECVATGVQHNSRSVAQVALVNEWCEPVFNAYIKQEMPIVSYLTELTGITKEILETQGRPLADVMAELRNCLPLNAILVGQNIHKDIQWLQLASGVDFDSMINLAHLFRVWSPARRSYTNFSQDHCAKVWLGMGERHSHDALTDATISMSLFNMYRQLQVYPAQMIDMQQRTLNAPRVPGFSKLHPVIDGCWYVTIF